MKILICLLSLFIFVGCGAKKTTSSNVQVTPTPTITPFPPNPSDPPGLPPSCTLTVTPTQVNDGQYFLASVTVGPESPVSTVVIDGVALLPGEFSTSLRKPVGTYTIVASVSGAGGRGSCSAGPVTVNPIVLPTPPSCNFSKTVYPPSLQVAQPMNFTLTLNPGSMVPTSVTINNFAAVAHPTEPNRWDLAINFTQPGMQTVLGTVANSAGSSNCTSSPVNVVPAPPAPICAIEVTPIDPLDGTSFTAIWRYTNDAASGPASLATLTYNGQTYSLPNPGTQWSKSLIAKYPNGVINGSVESAYGRGTCQVNFSPKAKPPCTGLAYAGSCWFASFPGQSCASVCSLKQGVYDSSAAYYAHNSAGCADILNRLRLVTGPAGIRSDKASGLSCFWYLPTLSGYVHTGSSPSASAADSEAARACACRI